MSLIQLSTPADSAQKRWPSSLIHSEQGLWPATTSPSPRPYVPYSPPGAPDTVNCIKPDIRGMLLAPPASSAMRSPSPS